MKHTKYEKSKLLLTAVFIVFCSFMLAAEPTIVFKATEIDFGEVESGNVKEMQFEFENAGTSPLIIKNVSSSCGCTAAKLEKKEYQPGEKGVIPTRFVSQGYSGRIVKTLTVTTNDPNNQHTILKVMGEVKLTKFAKIELSMDKIDFQNVETGKEYTRKINIKNPGTVELRIVEIIHAPEVSTRFTSKNVAAGESTDMTITLNPMDAGIYSSFVKIRTTAYKRPMSMIRLNAKIKGESSEPPADDKPTGDR